MTARRISLFVAASLVLVGVDAGARPGAGNTFRGSSSPSRSSSSSSRSSSPSRSYTPSRPSTPSRSYTPSRPSTPSTPSRPSSPSTPWRPSSPSSPSYPSSPGTSERSEPATPEAPPDNASAFALFFRSKFGMACFLTLLALLLYLVWSARQRDRFPDWASREPDQPPPPPRPSTPKRKHLERLRELDPNFSIVLFEDFLYALFAKVHEARGNGALDGLAAYVPANLRRRLAGGGLRDVKAVVIGAFDVTGVIGVVRDTPEVRVAVSFTANYTEVASDGTEQAFYVVEAWEVTRKRGALSPPPEKTRTFGCPNCGAPLENVEGSTCSKCGQVFDTGEFDWRVASIEVQEKEARPPQLTEQTEEYGNDLETIIDRDARENLAALQVKDPAFAWEGFVARVRLVFSELQVAWSERAWKRARPFVSDALFQTQLYWMDAYASQGLKNVIEEPEVVEVQMAKVTCDAWFDAVTVRVYATSLDYTVSEKDGNVVTGSKQRHRRYTEYWTLIRGSSRTGAARATPECPNCGAPLDVNMAGTCRHCSAKVTAGEFDWVLSRIEQDDVYAG
jgi:predicted lipid-binding transport protein (Tim44 family)